MPLPSKANQSIRRWLISWVMIWSMIPVLIIAEGVSSFANSQSLTVSCSVESSGTLIGLTSFSSRFFYWLSENSFISGLGKIRSRSVGGSLSTSCKFCWQKRDRGPLFSLAAAAVDSKNLPHNLTMSVAILRRIYLKVQCRWPNINDWTNVMFIMFLFIIYI